MSAHSTPTLTAITALTLLLCPLGSPGHAAWSVSSPVAQTRLVEVFTSQGCSSCPPADRWLSAFKGQALLWHAVVPVAWHVTYWNNLGWKDPFSRRQNDLRQRRLAAGLGTQVYTPGVFLDRGEWRGWRGHRRGDALANGRAIGVLSARSAAPGQPIAVTLAPAAGSDLTPPVVELVFLQMARSTAVKKGENRGRELRHDFVAGKVTRVNLRRQGARWVATIDKQPTRRQPGRGAVGTGSQRALFAGRRRLALNYSRPHVRAPAICAG